MAEFIAEYLMVLVVVCLAWASWKAGCDPMRHGWIRRQTLKKDGGE